MGVFCIIIVTEYLPIVMTSIGAIVLLVFNDRYYQKNKKIVNTYVSEGLALGMVLGCVLAVLLHVPTSMGIVLGEIISVCIGGTIKKSD
ncbi:hypothetical protein [Granulicatella balaenopterae]|uniref:hypothetical protein n=1 Tax=Granulicatella balaenopterae TaxID=137733 RepID=UPI000B7C994D|nr:hypothetical protein [Granulicatella balaenopterae]